MIFSYLLNMQSHPSWVCGLKQNGGEPEIKAIGVTPFVGVWIETTWVTGYDQSFLVTPFVGVWIETK